MVQSITELPSLIFIFLPPTPMSLVKTAFSGKVMNANMPHSLSASESIWKLQIIYPSSHLSPTIGFFFFPLTFFFFFPGEKQFLRHFHPPSYFSFSSPWDLGVLDAPKHLWFWSPEVTQLQEEGLRPGATRMDLWELKLTPWDPLRDWLLPQAGSIACFLTALPFDDQLNLVRLRMCQQVMLSNRVFNVPRHVAETFWRRRVEGDNLFVSQFFANFVSCGALLEKKNLKTNKQKKDNNSSISICFHPAGFPWVQQRWGETYLPLRNYKTIFFPNLERFSGAMVPIRAKWLRQFSKFEKSKAT